MTFSIGDSRDVSVLASLPLGLKAKESVDPERNRSLGNGSSLQETINVVHNVQAILITHFITVFRPS